VKTTFDEFTKTLSNSPSSCSWSWLRASWAGLWVQVLERESAQQAPALRELRERLQQAVAAL
jgi:hypothetical protein